MVRSGHFSPFSSASQSYSMKSVSRLWLIHVSKHVMLPEPLFHISSPKNPGLATLKYVSDVSADKIHSWNHLLVFADRPPTSLFEDLLLLHLNLTHSSKSDHSTAPKHRWWLFFLTGSVFFSLQNVWLGSKGKIHLPFSELSGFVGPECENWHMMGSVLWLYFPALHKNEKKMPYFFYAVSRLRK